MPRLVPAMPGDARGVRWSAAMDRGLVTAWVVNVTLLLLGTLWVFYDGGSRVAVEALLTSLGWLDSAEPIRDPSRLGLNVRLLGAGAVFAVASLGVLSVSLIWSPQRWRSTRFWLLFTTLVCGWLSLFMAWPALYWQGQQRRLRSQLPVLMPYTRDLSLHWPRDDGELPGVGPFLAYPKERPTTLLLLGPGCFPHTTLCFSAVERSGTEIVRFELAGDERGAWLEWWPAGKVPTSFVGGLGTHYELQQASRLTTHWYLVRYRTSGSVTCP